MISKIAYFFIYRTMEAKINQEIQTLLEYRENLYIQLQDIEKKLVEKNTLKNTIKIVKDSKMISGELFDEIVKIHPDDFEIK